jgi:tRNA1(Val) A37 N6-methylase TrmN6
MLAWRFPEAEGIGIEAQEVSARLARRSIDWNCARARRSRLSVLSGDFRDQSLLNGQPPFDLVTGTPPYFPIGTGTESSAIQRADCRFEHRGGIEDYCAAAARVLAPDGVFVACESFGQRARVEGAGHAAGLVLERWRDVVPRAGKTPLFSIFSMRRRDVASCLIVEEPLVVRDQAGRRTPAFVEVRHEMGMPP